MDISNPDAPKLVNIDVKARRYSMMDWNNRHTNRTNRVLDTGHRSYNSPLYLNTTVFAIGNTLIGSRLVRPQIGRLVRNGSEAFVQLAASGHIVGFPLFFAEKDYVSMANDSEDDTPDFDRTRRSLIAKGTFAILNPKQTDVELVDTSRIQTAVTAGFVKERELMSRRWAESAQ